MNSIQKQSLFSSNQQHKDIQLSQIPITKNILSRQSSKQFIRKQNISINQSFIKTGTGQDKQISKKYDQSIIINGRDMELLNGSKCSSRKTVSSSKKFQFKIISYLCQVAISYSITIGLLHLIKVSHFPYFEFLLIFGLMLSVSPWSLANTLILVSISVVIANYFLNIQILTYPIILICYLSVLTFIQNNKMKIVFIPVLIIVIIWGFIVIPSLFIRFAYQLTNPVGFYYMFPFFVFLIRIFLYLTFRLVKYSEYIFLQLPFFLLGMEYGVMMTLSVSSIQFWYLIVFFTLQIVNDRTQFMLNIMMSMLQSCNRIQFQKSKNPNKDKPSIKQPLIELDNDATKVQKSSMKIIQPDISILPAHVSGYNCIHSFHIICLIYVLTKLPLYSEPYTSDTRLYLYIQQQYYRPLVIWIFGFAYEAMCLILERKRNDKLLIGFTNNSILHTILRGVMLTIGLWMFYLGLGIGNYTIGKLS